MIGALQTTFWLGDRAGGILIEQARRAMFNLHETNHYLATNRMRARFTLPPEPTRAPLDAHGAHRLVDFLAGGVDWAAAAVVSSGGDEERALAERVQDRNRDLFELMHRLIDEEQARRGASRSSAPASGA